jgi:hypothetical protein
LNGSARVAFGPLALFRAGAHPYIMMLASLDDLEAGGYLVGQHLRCQLSLFMKSFTRDYFS